MWAFESYQIAKTKIYCISTQDANSSNGIGTTKASGSTGGFATGAQDYTDTPLPADYYSKMRPVVDQQLEKAGIRLAYVLNEIFR